MIGFSPHFFKQTFASRLVDHQVSVLASECQASRRYAKGAKEAATKKTTPRLACVF
jgi:hypothetical protein